MFIAPRLTDYHGIHLPQAELDFAIPLFDEDIPLYVDPFLLWRSPSQQDQGLYTSLINAFNHLGELMRKGQAEDAIATLIAVSECDEVGLGLSATRTGKRIGRSKAKEILRLFETVPDYGRRGFRHFEEIQFFVEGISKDRVSDIACSFLKSFLIDFTIDQCEKLNIPTQICAIENVYDYRSNQFVAKENAPVPVNPQNGKPIIFVPKRWLRFTPWISRKNLLQDFNTYRYVSHFWAALQLGLMLKEKNDFLASPERILEFAALSDALAERAATVPLKGQPRQVALPRGRAWTLRVPSNHVVRVKLFIPPLEPKALRIVMGRAP